MSFATPVDPEETRARILEEHESLRSLVDRIELLATRVLMKSDPDVALLRSVATQLCACVRRHVRFELEALRAGLFALDCSPQGSSEQQASAHVEADHELQLVQLGLFEQHVQSEEEDAYLLALMALGMVSRLRDDIEDEERLMGNGEIMRARWGQPRPADSARPRAREARPQGSHED